MALAGGGGRRFSRDTRGPQIRINHRIRVPEVRVVDADGSNLGVLSTEAALRRAQEVGLDLVEVNPKATPPVCKILDFGKYKYEEKKRARDAKRKQTIVEVKEIKLRPKTDDHDIDTKVRAARKFLEAGNKVKIVCRFRGREITHPERARMQLDALVQKLEDLANIEQRPIMEARTMAVLVAPKPIVFQRLASERAQRERERSKGDKSGQEHEGDEHGDEHADHEDDLDDDLDDDEDDEDDDESDDDVDEEAS
ncbi:MAG TPA: translation initiation factor IF-3 [Polyangiaceae bacterium]|nr:translation initiation factor IF-3 [Polyangiaceae bacterium]